MSVDPREVGRRIAEARQRRGWTQMTLALAARVTPSTVSRWERGRLPPTRALLRIAELLEVEPSVLVGKTDDTLEARVAALEERVAALETRADAT